MLWTAFESWSEAVTVIVAPRHYLSYRRIHRGLSYGD